MKIKSVSIVGILLAIFGYYFVYLVQGLTLLSKNWSQQHLALLGFGLIWILAFVLLAIVKWGEKQPFSSIGLKAIGWKEILLAVGLGILLSLTVPLLTLLAVQLLPTTGNDIQAVASTNAWWLLLISTFTAGIVEEIVFRGYLMERVLSLTGKAWAAVVVSLAAFVLPHLVSWNPAHVVGVVLPLGVVLSGLYLWKRNLVFNMIVHFMIDLPLVFMALMSGG